MLRIDVTNSLKQGLLISGLAAAIVIFGAGGSKAGSSAVAIVGNPQPANYLYVYNTPGMSVITGVQVSNSNALYTNQTSRTNVLNVLQLGPQSTAYSQQTGQNNGAVVIQISPPGLTQALP
ncbi:MAG: hypothetical protein WA733_14735 [Methylocystis sp.]